MNDRSKQLDVIGKVLFGVFMLVSISQISVGLYEKYEKSKNKVGCGCDGKK